MVREFYVVSEPTAFPEGHQFSITGTITGGQEAPMINMRKDYLSIIRRLLGKAKGRYLKAFTPEYRKVVPISKDRPYRVDGDGTLTLKLEPVTDLDSLRVYDSSGLVFSKERMSHFKLSNSIKVKALIEARCSGGWGGTAVESQLLLKGIQVFG